MTIKLYIICFVVAFLGMLLQTILKMKGLQDKAKVANMEYNPYSYFKQDWLSVSASLVTIFLFLLFVDNILKWKPAIVDYVKIGFAFVGYTGSDIASRIFGVVNRKINSVIDAKTDIADDIKK